MGKLTDLIPIPSKESMNKGLSACAEVLGSRVFG